MARTLASLADELGALRALMRDLRIREAELRAEVLAARPNGQVTGDRFVLNVTRSESRRFQRRALPDEILADPEYWSIKRTEVVKTVALDKEPASRGRDHAAEPDDFAVIERF